MIFLIFYFLLAFVVGGLGFEFCVFVAGWRHALRSEWPFIISIISESLKLIETRNLVIGDRKVSCALFPVPIRLLERTFLGLVPLSHHCTCPTLALEYAHATGSELVCIMKALCLLGLALSAFAHKINTVACNM